MNQPVPKVSRSDVDRIIERDFAPQDRDDLEVLLSDLDQSLSPRVLIAVLKLADGDMRKFESNLEAAHADWRDVIAYAEYPAYMKATAGAQRLSHERRDELVEADWEQYQSWLTR